MPYQDTLLHAQIRLLSYYKMYRIGWHGVIHPNSDNHLLRIEFKEYMYLSIHCTTILLNSMNKDE